MSNAVAPKPKEQNLPTIAPPRIPYHPMIGEKFGVDRAGWKALVEAVFPSAKTIEGVALALAYCKARNLDIFKRVVHIVPIWNSKLGKEVETVWPGIGELRTTAHRTGEYAGKADTAFGPPITKHFSGTVGGGQNQRQVEFDVTFPEWAQVTCYRLVKGTRCEFVGPKVFWLETYATIGKSDVPNDMWQTRPFGQLDKCAEAAALRVAYPEEIGSEYIDEEVQHRRAVDNTATGATKPHGGTSALAAKITQKAEERAPDLEESEHVEQGPADAPQSPDGASDEEKPKRPCEGCGTPADSEFCDACLKSQQDSARKNAGVVVDPGEGQGSLLPEEKPRVGTVGHGRKK